MNIPKITPRHDQILVKPDGEPSRETETGLIRPDNEEMEKKATGIVVAVGPKITDLTEGQRVIYGAYAGEQLNYSDDPKHVDFVLLADEDVLATVDETVIWS